MADHEADGGEAGDLAAPGPAAIEAGRLLFAREARFVAGATTLAALPPEGLPEVAFAGRSNVGKSSLVNAVTGRNTLARTSQTPGHTRQLNFFNLDDRLMLVDLPGYGYARAPKGQVRDWTRLIEDYLRGRVTLARVCLLIDARHGLKASDRQAMAMLDQAAVVYMIVLTKADAPSAGQLRRTLAEIDAEARRHTAAFPAVLATSARSGAGIPELRAHLAALARGQ
ncbi:MAG: ribosome biogenesis GTP-binding protein YihA/YsxC [Thalassobaculales bacterium]